MKFRILLLCLLICFLPKGNSMAACTLTDDQICSASDLPLPEVEEYTDGELHYIPFIPRKLKSKARDVIEIPNVFIDWNPYYFSPPGFLFVQNNKLSDRCTNLFLRGPPCA